MCNVGHGQLASIYSYKINGVIYKQYCTQDVCFRTSLAKCKSDLNNCDYTIVLCKDPYIVENVGYNNFCWMEKHQVENYLRRISSIKSFKYKVYEDQYRKTLCYKIDLHIEGTKKEVTFVLQCIKRLYEFPYSFFLFEAYQMQQLPEFRFDSILNLFNVAWSAYYPDKNSGHSFSGTTKFEQYSTLRNKLPKVKNVTDLYPNLVGGLKRMKLPKSFNRNYYGNIPCNTDLWTKKRFKEVLPIYVENYNALKK